MRLEKTATGLIIHDPSDAIKQKVLRYFSLSNPVREFFIYHTNAKKDIVNVKGFIEDSLEHGKRFNHDTIYITSGFLNTRDQIIQNLPTPKRIQPHTPEKIEVKMNREPRSPLQEDCIKKMTTSKSEKITIELKPGVDFRHPYRVIGMIKFPFELLEHFNAYCATT